MKRSCIDSYGSLFLCRTPLQARICQEIVAEEDVGVFDVVYLTHNDSESDRLYYNELKKDARRGFYIYYEKRNPDVLNSILSIVKVKKFLNGVSYSRVFIASINNYAFRYAIKKSRKAGLYSFDDGTANFTKHGVFFNLDNKRRSRFYAKILGLPSSKEVIDRVIRHYTIYKGFSNIVEQERVVNISCFDFSGAGGIRNERKKTVKFFVGQPFSEYLCEKEVARLRDWLSKNPIDYYLVHPRESSPLISSAKIVKESDLLAEDLILKLSQDIFPIIIASYSTVLFNVPRNSAEKIYLSIKDDANEKPRLELIAQAGCSVIKV